MRPSVGRDETPNGAILAALDAGDAPRAATLAIEAYGPELLGYVLAVLGDEDAAGDVFSDLCEHLWRGITRFRRTSSVRTWAYAIAWRRVQRHLRDLARRRARPLRTGEASQLAANVRSSVAPWLRDTVKDRIHDLRRQLSPEEQTLLVLRVDRQLSWQDVAQVMGGGVDEAAVRKRFERVKEKLRRLASEAGLLESR